MRKLTASDLLCAWERCLDEPPAIRPATLLALAEGDVAPVDAAKWSISHRDAGLLTLREQLFGGTVTAVITCPDCGELAEVSFSIDQVRTKSDGETFKERPLRSKSSLRIGNRRIRYRAPTSEDLLAISSLSDPVAARRALLERCAEVICDQHESDSRTLINDEIAARVSQRLAREEAQADVHLKVKCPACGNALEPLFDIASFLWRELDDWARKVLREIHVIARNYGWREADILQMSARRRRTYLDLLGA
jgi:ribosomal protein S27E